MLELKLKRLKGNKSVTHGVLTIPQYDFRCRTLELADGSDMLYKNGCCVDKGTYVLRQTVAENSYFMPIFKKKPKGFAKNPQIVFAGLNYLHLATGNIGLGVDPQEDFSIGESTVLKEKALEIFSNCFRNREMMVLNIEVSKNFQYSDLGYYDVQKKCEEDLDFIEGFDEDEEEV